MADFGANDLSAAFLEHRARLLDLVRRRLNPVLRKRFDPEDVLSVAYENAARRLDYFGAHEDVPVYFKFRTILLQALVDLERRHLAAGARDAYREVGSEADERLAEFAADITSPASRVDRDERHALLRRAVAALSEGDRQIIVLRHFDGLGNAACAEILGIEPKAASIRHVRALERLQRKLAELSCFRKEAPHGNT